VQVITQWLSSGWSIILVILGLGLIIFLHELGHFLMAKKNGVRVEIFSLGFGQAIFKFRRGETEYRIAWLPLGGYVKMAGETLMDERKGEPFELTSKTPWQRFQIFTAGALMNLIIAFPIAMLSFVIGKCESPNEVGNPGKAEAMAGIEPGDVVEEVGGRKIDSVDKLRIEMIRHANGTRIPVKVKRGTETKEFFVESSRSTDHLTAPPQLMLAEPIPGKPLQEQGVRAKDELVRINGVQYFHPSKADPKLKELGLCDDPAEAARAAYENYTRNALLLQLRRIRTGDQIEEDHMRNRQMVAHWILKNSNAIELRERDGKHFAVVVDPVAWREAAGRLLALVQQIKSTGDYAGAKALFDEHGVHFDPALRDEVVARYETLNVPSYTAFVQPRLSPVWGQDGKLEDVTISAPLSLETQMLEWSGRRPAP